MKESRGNWYLLTGLIIGLGLGLLISIVLSPIQYVDTDPAALQEPYKNDYRKLISAAFLADGNLPRARERLALLQDDDSARALAAQAQRILADGGSPDDARGLALLAAALTSGTVPTGSAPTLANPDATPGAPVENTPAAISSTQDSADAVRTPTPAIPTATQRPTFTPRPSATPPQVLDAPFSMVKKDEVCDSSLAPGTLAVQVNDQNGSPLAGVRITITWPDGQDHFYSGLAPDINPGYADFSMTSGVNYTLRVGDAGQPVNDLSIPACGGGWKVEFQEGSR